MFRINVKLNYFPIMKLPLWLKIYYVKKALKDLITKLIGFYFYNGNNVVFVEKTADLSKAAKDIVNSKSFNNGLLPGVEQSIIVETDIYENMKLELEKNGAYFLSDTERKNRKYFI